MKVIFKDPKNEEYFKNLDKRWNQIFGSSLPLEGLTEVPTDDQKEWILHRLAGPARSWERWFVGKYFTEEQKRELGLTDEDIAGRGMA